MNTHPPQVHYNPYGPDAPEQIIVRFRRHGRVLILPVIALLLGVFLAGMYLGAFPQTWQNILVAVGVAVLIFGGFVIPFSAWFVARSTITTKRIISRSGVFTRVRQEVSINRVRSVSSRRGILQRMLGAGSVDIYVAGTEKPLELIDVPSVKQVSAVLQQLVESSYMQDRIGAGVGMPQYTQMPAAQQSQFVVQRQR